MRANKAWREAAPMWVEREGQQTGCCHRRPSHYQPTCHKGNCGAAIQPETRFSTDSLWRQPQGGRNLVLADLTERLWKKDVTRYKTEHH